MWVNQHNLIRKKIDYIWYPWGNIKNQVFKDNEKVVLKYNKPDVLLCKLKDNQREIQWIAPIEIQQTQRPFRALQFIYIKESKLKRYDKVTSQIATRSECILFVAGSEPNERCYFIGSKQLEQLKKTQKPESFGGLGGNPSYTIPITTKMRNWAIPLRGDKFRDIAQVTLGE